MRNKSTVHTFSKILRLFISLSFCLACTRKVTNLESPVTHVPHMTFPIEPDYRTTWNAVIRAVTDFPEHTIQSSVKRKGTIVVAPVAVMTEGYCNCGNTGEDRLTGPGRTTAIRLNQNHLRKRTWRFPASIPPSTPGKTSMERSYVHPLLNVPPAAVLNGSFIKVSCVTQNYNNGLTAQTHERSAP